MDVILYGVEVCFIELTDGVCSVLPLCFFFWEDYNLWI